MIEEERRILMKICEKLAMKIIVIIFFFVDKARKIQ